MIKTLALVGSLIFGSPEFAQRTAHELDLERNFQERYHMPHTARFEYQKFLEGKIDLICHEADVLKDKMGERNPVEVRSHIYAGEFVGFDEETTNVGNSNYFMSLGRMQTLARKEAQMYGEWVDFFNWARKSVGESSPYWNVLSEARINSIEMRGLCLEDLKLAEEELENVRGEYVYTKYVNGLPKLSELKRREDSLRYEWDWLDGKLGDWYVAKEPKPVEEVEKPGFVEWRWLDN